MDQKASNITWADANEMVATHGSGILDHVFATVKGKGKDATVAAAAVAQEATFQTYNTVTDINQFLEEEEGKPRAGH